LITYLAVYVRIHADLLSYSETKILRDEMAKLHHVVSEVMAREAGFSPEC